MWKAALTTFDKLNEPHTLTDMEPARFLQHLDESQTNAIIVENLAIWTAADGTSFASAMLPLDDPNDAEITARDFGEIVKLWF